MAFEEVCPERIDLIHKNYRKLCNLLIDIDEWGQVAVIHMLTRYARTQFVDPNKEVLFNMVFEQGKKSVVCHSTSTCSESLTSNLLVGHKNSCFNGVGMKVVDKQNDVVKNM